MPSSADPSPSRQSGAQGLPAARSPPAVSARFSLIQLLPEEIKRDFFAAARPRTIPDGHIIYQQGDIGHEMYHIVSGEVRLFFMHPDGRELVFTSFEPGDSFGYSTLVDGEPLPHTAEANGSVHVQVLSAAAFKALRARHRGLDEALLVLLCRHLRVLNTFFVDASLEDLMFRLARRLLEVARPGEGDLPSVRLSQAELSLMFGVSRQTVNKLLKQLEELGLVQLSYGAVILRDLVGLRLLSASD